MEDVVKLLKSSGFEDFYFTQTLFSDLKNVQYLEPVISGHGKGSFVVVRAVK